MKFFFAFTLIIFCKTQVTGQEIDKFRTNTLTMQTLVEGVWINKETINFSTIIVFDYASEKIKLFVNKNEEFDIVKIKTELNSIFFKVIDPEGNVCDFEISSITFEGKIIGVIRLYTANNTYSFTVNKI
jgi:hypothetical protein